MLASICYVRSNVCVYITAVFLPLLSLWCVYPRSHPGYSQLHHVSSAKFGVSLLLLQLKLESIPSLEQHDCLPHLSCFYIDAPSVHKICSCILLKSGNHWACHTVMRHNPHFRKLSQSVIEFLAWLHHDFRCVNELSLVVTSWLVCNQFCYQYYCVAHYFTNFVVATCVYVLVKCKT